ncbi:carbamoyltransferase C-terminal domain-containing protein [Pseudomonas sp. RA_5y_Pfl1_P24]|uniref:carbamoyltransferase C-terminal domain-containing protein n=1 Tax=Pseudomonas sp. RA_5y_Pfl1_P24 TaxID=3088706 RepID=UPI0030DDCDB0
MVSVDNNDIVILGFKDGHDGAVALIIGDHLEFSVEAEKDNGLRYSSVTPDALLKILHMVNKPLDIVAQSGWRKGPSTESATIGAGYSGLEKIIYQKRSIFGHDITYFSSSHERSHLLCGYGLSPFPQGQPCYALLWEGHFGAFYRIDENVNITKLGSALENPGDRFAFLYALADPTFNLGAGQIRLSDAGKLMALAAYGEKDDIDEDARHIIATLLDKNMDFRTFHKRQFHNNIYYNIGFDDPRLASLAHHLSNAIFNLFRDFAQQLVFDKAPLLIVGGCGLNCDWNSKWKETQLFSDVFIPPCTNDSGSAIGTAIDALLHTKGLAKITWSPYAGELSQTDTDNTGTFISEPYDMRHVAQLLHEGCILGWVQGRYEMGPRALGNRSILAAPWPRKNLDRLNKIKKREGFRPIAPICLEECMDEYFYPSNPSPFMLEFRKVISAKIPAVTHVDNSARPQSVNKSQNLRMHQLLTAYRDVSGVGVLCNTSLNFNGRGFINRLSDLHRFASEHDLDGFVVEDSLFLNSDRHNENIK